MRVLVFALVLAILGLAAVGFAHESSEDSKVVTLGGDLPRQVEESDKPFFVMFFAPWCPHCKQLLPTWDQASVEHGDIANWGTVDCTQHEKICMQYQIQGYPTLKLFNHGAVLDFQGERSLSGFVEFIERANRPPLTEVSSKDEFDAFVQEKPSFIAFFGSKPERDAVESAAKQYQTTTDFVSTEDVSFGKEYKVSKTPALVAVNPDSVINFEGDFEASAIRDWLARARLGLVPELGPHNFGELTGTGKPLVIVAVDPNADYYQDRLDAARQVSKKYFDSFIFAWLDGVRWAQYLENAFKIPGDQVPVVVALDPVKEEFFQSSPETVQDFTELLDGITSGSIKGTSLRQTPSEPEGYEKYKVMVEQYVQQYTWYCLGAAFVVGFVVAKILSALGGSSGQPAKKKKKD